jgi:hypothetical protein
MDECFSDGLQLGILFFLADNISQQTSCVVSAFAFISEQTLQVDHFDKLTVKARNIVLFDANSGLLVVGIDQKALGSEVVETSEE